LTGVAFWIVKLREFDENLNDSANIFTDVVGQAYQPWMIGVRHGSRSKRVIKRDHHQIMFGSIGKVFCIVIFAFHFNINRHDYMITALAQRIR
jgi:hypothetical protein